MKSGLLTIFFLVATAQIVSSQNVRVIRASERSTVVKSVIIPAPVPAVKTNDSAEAVRKVTPVPSVNSSTKRNSDVKSVRGGSCKKPCVKKVSVDKKKSKTVQSPKPAESTRK